MRKFKSISWLDSVSIVCVIGLAFVALSSAVVSAFIIFIRTTGLIGVEVLNVALDPSIWSAVIALWADLVVCVFLLFLAVSGLFHKGDL